MNQTGYSKQARNSHSASDKKQHAFKPCARLKPQTKGLIRRKVVDLKWEGGELADELNRDDKIKKHLLQQLKEGKGSGQVRDVSPDKKAGIVWITTTKYMPPFPKSVTPFSIPDDLMPSETSFNNAIARVIRNRASPQSD